MSEKNSALPPRLQGLIQDGFFALCSIILLYCANQIASINSSISELNNKLSVYISRVDSTILLVSDHENRIRILEKEK